MSDHFEATSDWDEAAAQSIIAHHLALEGPMLPILHGLQAHFGHVPADATTLIADALNLSRAEVVGTISFYHHFHTEKPPARVVQLCRAEACRAVGCEDVVQQFEATTGLRPDRPTAEVGIETVYCLGNCALGPSAMVDGTLFGRVDTDKLAELCGLTAGEAVQ